MITASLLGKGLSYQDYKKLIIELLEKGKTTGNNHSDQMVSYTKMNVQRMNRWDKTAVISQGLQNKILSINTPQIWLILSEAWCGDAAQNIPFIAKLADMNRFIQLRILLRDEHPAVMDQYLTNGSRSIPKLIAIHANTFEELFRWGPRPQILHQKVLKFKENPQNQSKKEFMDSIHLWYAQDKNRSLDAELSMLLEEV